MRASRRAAIVIAVAAVLLVTAVALRHQLLRSILQPALSLSTGYGVRFDDQRVGFSHAAFLGVHVTKNGDPVLDADRVDVSYALRDVFPGGEHRYGFAALSVQHPVLTIVRHEDGSFTFTRPGGTGASPPAATKRAAAPLFFTARVRDGVIRLVDRAPRQPDLAVQTIENVAIDASVKSDARTTARVDGVLIARRTQGGSLERYPLSVRTRIDVTRGLSLTRLRAAALPVRGILGFLIHTPVVRFDDGVLHDVAASYDGVANPGDPFDYRLGATFALRDGRLAVSSLERPLRDLGATFVLADGTLGTRDVHGSIAETPLQGRGALYDLFGTPRFRLALAADADLARFKSIFAFSRREPLSGTAHLETLLTSKLDDPLIRTAFTIPHAAYDRYPVEALDGVVDYMASTVVIHGARGKYGSARLAIGGRILIGRDGDDLGFAVAAHGPGAALPYANAIAPDAEVALTALLREPPRQGFSARGSLAATGTTRGSGTFAVDQHGVGEFGPFAFVRDDGSSLAGGFELQRPISQSAGWLRLRGYRIADVRRAPVLPGVIIPEFPPLAGRFDADLAAGGTPDAFGLAGTVRGRDLRVAGMTLGSGSVRLAGSMADVRLADLVVDGPLGRFAGAGAYANGTFAVDGSYDGSLAALAPLTHEPSAAGSAHGPLRAAIAGGRIVVQSTGTALRDARVRGVALEHVAGTMLVDGSALRIVAADGSVGGSRAVAADVGGPFLVSAAAIPARALRGTGLPLQSGELGLFGVADLRGGPRFDGLVALADGSAGGYPVSGGADVLFTGSRATVRDGTAALGETFGDFDGRVDVGRGNVGLDLGARVRLGEFAELRRALRLPLRTLEGSFTADLRVGGTSAAPQISGGVTSSGGSYNGLAYRDARAKVAVTRDAVAARDATILVGSTRARGDVSYIPARSAFAIDVRSGAADLADFDDYFDEAETLDGRGPVALAFANDGRSTRTSGQFDVSGLRVRRFALGRVRASWNQRGGTIGASLAIRGAHSTLAANGTIAPAAGPPVAAFRNAFYRGGLRATGVRLATWLPAAGIRAPILGQVDTEGTVAGRFPRLALDGTATLRDGSFFGHAVRTGTVHARSDGARIALSPAVLDFGFARFEATGSFGMGRRDRLALAVHLQTADLSRALAALDPKGSPPDVAGNLVADARSGGTFAAPRATVGFEAADARYRSLAIPHILGSVAYDGRTLTVNDAEATFAKGSVLVAGTLPLATRPFGVLRTAPLSFTLAATALDLSPFAPFVPGPQTKLGGTVNGRVAVEGTLLAPSVVGDASLTDTSYFSAFDRAGVTHANAQLMFLGSSVALESLRANVGGGSLEGSGRLDLPFPDVHTSGYSISLTARGARIDSPQFGRGTIDGNLGLASGAHRPILSGNVTLSNASIPILSIYRSVATPAGASGAANPFDLDFDVLARAGRNVRIQAQNPFIDVGATGTLDLTGSLLAPRALGTLVATPGGIFSTYNHAFRVQQATVTFVPEQGLSPTIDLRAYAHVTDPDPDPTRNAIGSADITVTVRGSADEIASGSAGVITYASNPPYSEEQIAGLLLDASVFGAINFGQQQNGTTLRGAPGESNALLPPGVTPYQSGILNFNQEAFSILNGQLTQRYLAPVERILSDALGLSDVELTVDYGGGVGFDILKQIGRKDVYASLGQTLTWPSRTTLGFTSRPDAATSISFTYFNQNGLPALTANANGTSAFSNVQRLKGIQALSNRQGFTFSVVRKYP